MRGCVRWRRQQGWQQAGRRRLVAACTHVTEYMAGRRLWSPARSRMRGGARVHHPIWTRLEAVLVAERSEARLSRRGGVRESQGDVGRIERLSTGLCMMAWGVGACAIHHGDGQQHGRCLTWCVGASRQRWRGGWAWRWAVDILSDGGHGAKE